MTAEAFRAVSGGEIDYSLKRRALLRDVSAGRVRPEDVCDAHPELRRAALSVGERTQRSCPLCDEKSIVLVRYVFGPRLPRHGRCLATEGDLERIMRRKGIFDCYEVEVCTGCWWNHLTRRFTFSGSRGD